MFSFALSAPERVTEIKGGVAIPEKEKQGQSPAVKS
jgi:hypothetical protein